MQEFDQQDNSFNLVYRTNSQSKLAVRGSVDLSNSDVTLLGSVLNHTCCFYSPNIEPHILILLSHCLISGKFFPSSLLHSPVSFLRAGDIPNLKTQTVHWSLLIDLVPTFSIVYQGLVKCSSINAYWQTLGIQWWKESILSFPLRNRCTLVEMNSKWVI